MNADKHGKKINTKSCLRETCAAGRGDLGRNFMLSLEGGEASRLDKARILTHNKLGITPESHVFANTKTLSRLYLKVIADEQTDSHGYKAFEYGLLHK